MVLDDFILNKEASGVSHLPKDVLQKEINDWSMRPASAPDCIFEKMESYEEYGCCDGWEGDDCNIAICHPGCQNGGVCKQPSLCECPEGFVGYRCEDSISDVTDELQYCYQSKFCFGEKANDNSPALLSMIDCCLLNQGASWGVTGLSCTPCIGPNVIEKEENIGFSTCLNYGKNYWRTFDGLEYRFGGLCKYVMAKTALWHVSISMINCHSFSTCRKELDMVFDLNTHIIAVGDKIIDTNGTEIRVDETNGFAANTGGVIITKSGEFYFLTARNAAEQVKVKWNNESTVYVTLSDDHVGDVRGLCGNHDKISYFENEFVGPRGDFKYNPISFGNSWDITPPGQSCPTTTIDICECTDEQLEQEARQACQHLRAFIFSPCHGHVKVDNWFSSCMCDFCDAQKSGEDASEVVCTTTAAYAHMCTEEGVIIPWRTSRLCPKTCPEGMEYTECGSTCPSTCASLYVPYEEQCALRCEPMCQCREGTWLHNGKCIKKEDCPCYHHKEEYSRGTELDMDCNSCVCEYGRWKCTENPCSATCKVVGALHYTTFDDTLYDLEGRSCYYDLVRPDIEFSGDDRANLVISARHDKCSGDDDLGFCVKSVRIFTRDLEILLDQNFEVSINHQTFTTKLPFVSPFVHVKRPTSDYMVVSGFGFHIEWDGLSRLYITLSPFFMNKVKGLCGLYDANKVNDFTSELGPEVHAADFAEHFLSRDASCTNQAFEVISAPCSADFQLQREAELSCSLIISSVFARSWSVARYEYYHKLCMNDYCLRRDGSNVPVCTHAAALARDSASKGVEILWREDPSVRARCPLMCESGSVYGECHSDCQNSCHHIEDKSFCSDTCLGGCQCEAGKYLDNSGTCVSKEFCSCNNQFDPMNGLIGPGETVELNCANCTCTEGLLHCGESKCAVAVMCPPTQIYREDLPSCGSTCLDAAYLGPCNNKQRKGCGCPDGQYLNEFERCVDLADCSCLYGGEYYLRGDAMSFGCQKYMCKNGVWDLVSTSDCAAVCWASGDPHYTTFDGVHYSFMGSCSYELVTHIDQDFSVSVENVPCGVSGVTCTKSINLRVEGYVIHLVRGKNPSINNVTLNTDSYTSSVIDIAKAGVFFVISVPHHGLQLMWDQGTRIYVMLHEKHMGMVSGLCGNYNGKTIDDFITRGGSKETRASVFGETWKLSSSCPAVLQDAPDEKATACGTVNGYSLAHRKPWAMEKCSIILEGDMFAECRIKMTDQVLDSYYADCLYDACRCDKGGDCECLCTAIANFAQECGKLGYYVKWRSQELCPMQCEHEMEYRACGPPCPQTCDNIGEDKAPYCNVVQCVEGCFCPENYVKLGDDCVEALDCPCKHNGHEYPPQSQLVHNCLNCTCDHGQWDCIGEECAKATCSPHDFTCHLSETRRCIPKQWMCDKMPDCEYGEDEADCVYECSSQEFSCIRSGKCIDRGLLCDGQYDCADRSDELMCVLQCEESQFRCQSGRCIPKAFVCDGYHDCGPADNTDEHNCTVPSCKAVREIHCVTLNFDNLCLPASHVCDGHDDCGDGKDEIGCECLCSNETYTCNHTCLCIDPNKICDGANDCGDNSDETNCACGEGYYTCNDETCQPPSAKCNGVYDCAEGEDEDGCGTTTTSTTEPFTTTTTISTSTTTLSYTTTPPCQARDGMADAHYIPADWIDVPNGFSYQLRANGQHKWRSQPPATFATIVVTFPAPYPSVHEISLSEMENIETFLVTGFSSDNSPIKVPEKIVGLHGVTITSADFKATVLLTETTWRRSTTTPTEKACEPIDGMDEISFIPDHFLWTSSGEKRNLRPEALTPWISDDDSPQIIIIQLAENPNNLTHLEYILFPEVENVFDLLIEIATSTDGIFETVSSFQDPKAGVRYYIENDVYKIKLILSKRSLVSPIVANLDVNACFKKAAMLTTPTPSKPATSVPTTTTSEACEPVDGMDELAFLPNDFLRVSSGEKNNLRPAALTPWISGDESPQTIIIQLTENPDNLTHLEYIIFPELENTFDLVIKITKSTAEVFETVSMIQDPKAGVRYYIENDVYKIKLILSKRSPVSPIVAKLDVNACFKKAAVFTTATTTPTTKPATSTQTATTAKACEPVDGMDELAFLPDDFLYVTSGDKRNLRPDAPRSWSSGDERLQTIIIQLAENPNDLTHLEYIVFPELVNAYDMLIEVIISEDGVYQAESNELDPQPEKRYLVRKDVYKVKITLNKENLLEPLIAKLDVNACFKKVAETTTHKTNVQTTTNNYAETTTMKATPSPPSTSTTPTPCEKVEGMSDPLLVPSDRIHTTSSDSPVDDLRPESLTPWFSTPEVGVLPYIIIRLAEDNEPTAVDEIVFPILENVDRVEIYVSEASNESPRLLTVVSDLPTSNASIPIEPGTEAAFVYIILVPEDDTQPITVKVGIFACLKELTTVTSAATTTAGPTTGSTKTTEYVTSSTATSKTTTVAPSTSTTPTPCTKEEGMSNPLLIPTDRVTTTSSDSPIDNLRPGSPASWKSTPQQDVLPNITIALTDDGSSTELESITLLVADNVKTAEVYSLSADGETYVLAVTSSALPVTDAPIPLEPGTETSSVSIVLTPIDVSEPIAVRLSVLACLKEITPTTGVPATTTTTKPVTTSTGISTTPTPCKDEEGMSDPSLIPTRWIQTTLSRSALDGLRPDSSSPWQSSPEVGVLPSITIRLTETGEKTDVTELNLELDNVESVDINVAETLNEPSRLVVSDFKTLTGSNPIPLENRIKAAVIEVVLTPVDPTRPVSVRVKLHACLVQVSSTPAASTTSTAAITTKYVATTTVKTTPSPPSTSTTPTPCEKVEGMSDPLLVPSDRIHTTSSDSPVDDLRPESLTPWISTPEVGVLPYIIIRLAEDNEPTAVDEIVFPILENVDRVEIYVSEASNESPRLLTVVSDLPTSNASIPIEPGTEAAFVYIILVPEDDTQPITVKVGIFACLKELTTVTSAATTTAGPTTGSTKTTEYVTSSTATSKTTTVAPSTSTTPTPCTKEEGMSNPLLIPTDRVTTTSSDSPIDNLRPGSPASWKSTPQQDVLPNITIALTDDGSSTELESITLLVADNVKTAEVYILSADGETFVLAVTSSALPVTDAPIPLEPGTETSSVSIVLTPIDVSEPIAVRLSVLACLKEITPTTGVPATTTTTKSVTTSTGISTTPTPCKDEEGMSDPSLIPTRWIQTTLSRSALDGLRPDSSSPWQSSPEVGVLPSITIRLTETGEKTDVTELNLELDNVESVDINVAETLNEPSRLVVSDFKTLTGSNPIPLENRIKAAVIEVVLTPVDPTRPVSVRVKLHACLVQVSSTPAASTTSTAAITTKYVETTTVKTTPSPPSTSTTPTPCEKVEGMSDPLLVPSDRIRTTSSDSPVDDLRPESLTPWISTPEVGVLPNITIRLAEDNEPTAVDEIVFPILENVDRVEVYVSEASNESARPLTVVDDLPTSNASIPIEPGTEAAIVYIILVPEDDTQPITVKVGIFACLKKLTTVTSAATTTAGPTTGSTKTTEYVTSSTATSKTTTVAPSTSTTPTPCTKEEGMSNPLLIPTDRVTTTSSDSPIDNLRPGSPASWKSTPQQDVLPNITIALTDDGSSTELESITLLVADNVKTAEVYILSADGETFVLAVTSSALPVTDAPIPLEPGTETSSVSIVLTPIDVSEPIAVRLSVLACLKEITPTTGAPATTTTTKSVTTSTGISTTPTPCKDEEGMSDPSLIPTRWIQTTLSRSALDGLRPDSSSPWQSSPEVGVLPSITIRLTETGEKTDVTELNLELDNVESVDINVAETLNEPSRLVVSDFKTLTGSNPIPLENRIKAAVIEVVLTPVDPTRPVSVRVKLHACLVQVSSTPAASTTSTAAITTKYVATTTVKTTPSPPSTSTTPTPCEKVEGMSDPLLVPSDRIHTTSSDSPVDDLRPESLTPWFSTPEVGVLPYIIIRLAEDNEPTAVDEIVFPILENVDRVEIYVSEASNESPRLLTVVSDLPTSNASIPIEPGTEAAFVYIILVPEDDTQPITVKVGIFACLKELTTVTSAATTTAGPTTGSTKTTEYVTSSTATSKTTTVAPSTSTTPTPCTKEEGMSNPLLIPTDRVTTTSSDSPIDNLRPGSPASWKSTPQQDVLPNITIALTDDGSSTELESITLLVADNVKTAEVYILSADGETFVLAVTSSALPVTDAPIPLEPGTETSSVSIVLTPIDVSEPIAVRLSVLACLKEITPTTGVPATTTTTKSVTTSTGISTTPTPCKDEEGMSDPSLIPTRWIQTTLSRSALDGLRPDSSSPWQSSPEVGVLPSITIRLTETGEKTDVTELNLELDNVESVDINVAETLNEPSRLVVSDFKTLTGSNPIPLENRIKAAVIEVVLTPVDPTRPVSVRVKLHACLVQVSSTPAASTTSTAAITTKYVETTTVKTTPSPPSTSTTPTPCEKVEGMSDPLLVPSDRIRTTSSDSPVDDLRPESLTPWISTPEVGVLPNITIRLAEDNEPTAVDEIVFPILENVDRVEVYVSEASNESARPLTVVDDLPTSNASIPIEPGTEAAIVYIILVPEDDTQPITVKVGIFACLKKLTTVTSAATTTAGPTTGSTKTTEYVTSSTATSKTTTVAPSTSTTPTPCTKEEGMSNPLLIPTDRVTTTSSDSPIDNLRPGSPASWKSTPQQDVLPNITIALTDDGSSTELESITLLVADNVKTAEVYILSADGETFVLAVTSSALPVTDAPIPLEPGTETSSVSIVLTPIDVSEPIAVRLSVLACLKEITPTTGAPATTTTTKSVTTSTGISTTPTPCKDEEGMSDPSLIPTRWIQTTLSRSALDGLRPDSSSPWQSSPEVGVLPSITIRLTETGEKTDVTELNLELDNVESVDINVAETLNEPSRLVVSDFKTLTGSNPIPLENRIKAAVIEVVLTPVDPTRPVSVRVKLHACLVQVSSTPAASTTSTAAITTKYVATTTVKTTPSPPSTSTTPTPCEKVEGMSDPLLVPSDRIHTTSSDSPVDDLRPESLTPWFSTPEVGVLPYIIIRLAEDNEPTAVDEIVFPILENVDRVEIYVSEASNESPRLLTVVSDLPTSNASIPIEPGTEAAFVYIILVPEDDTQPITVKVGIFACLKELTTVTSAATTTAGPTTGSTKTTEYVTSSTATSKTTTVAPSTSTTPTPSATTTAGPTTGSTKTTEYVTSSTATSKTTTVAPSTSTTPTPSATTTAGPTTGSTKTTEYVTSSTATSKTTTVAPSTSTTPTPCTKEEGMSNPLLIPTDRVTTTSSDSPIDNLRPGSPASWKSTPQQDVLPNITIALTDDGSSTELESITLLVADNVKTAEVYILSADGETFVLAVTSSALPVTDAPIPLEPGTETSSVSIVLTPIDVSEPIAVRLSVLACLKEITPTTGAPATTTTTQSVTTSTGISTTPTPCKDEEGMSDPSLIPTRWIQTTLSRSALDGLRPDSSSPWQSSPEVGVLPSITIRLTETGEKTDVTELNLELDNVESVDINVAETLNEPSRLVVSDFKTLTGSNPIPLENRIKAAVIEVVLTPVDPTRPVSVRVKLHACLVQVSSTPAASTTSTAAITTKYVETTTVKTTPSPPSTSTTPTPCEKVEGMSDPLLVPSDRIRTTSSDSPVDDLRPESLTPWISTPEVGVLPNITIRLAEDNEPTAVDEIVFPILENVDRVEVYVSEASNESARPLTVVDDLPTSNASIPIEPGTEAAIVYIILVPEDDTQPITVKVGIFACLKKLTTVTSAATTTAGPTTGSTKTTEYVTSSTATSKTTTVAPSTSTTPTPCTKEEGMSNPLLIPTDRVTTTSSDSPIDNLRPGSPASWKSTPQQDVLPNITIALTDDGSSTELESITLLVADNVKTAEVYILSADGETFVLAVTSSALPVTDAPIPLEPGTETSSVSIVLTPIDVSEPIAVRLSVLVCLKEITPTTGVPATTTTTKSVTTSTGISTTPTPCKDEEGMSDPSLIPTRWIQTTLSRSALDGLRPDSSSPWQSSPEVGVLPSITIRLTETGEKTDVTELNLELDNVESVDINVAETLNEPSRLVVSDFKTLTGSNPIPLENRIKAAVIEVVLTPVDPTRPVSVRVKLHACLVQVSSTPAASTTSTAAITTKYVETTTVKTTPSPPSTSTTPTPCEKVEGMSDPLLVPSDRIRTTSSDSPVDDLRPESLTPWISTPEVGVLPNITIRLAEDNEPTAVDEVVFPILENVDRVDVYVSEASNESARPLTVVDDLPTSNASIPIEPGTEAAIVYIILVPEDDTQPITVKVGIFACLKKLTTVTSAATTTAGPTTGSTKTTEYVTSSTATSKMTTVAPSTSTTPTPCTKEEGMSNPLLIPTDRVTTTSSDSPIDNLRPGSPASWKSTPQQDVLPNITIALTDDGSSTELESITLIVSDNIDSVEMFILNVADQSYSLVASLDQLPETNATLPVDPRTETSSISLLFTPTDKLQPISVKLSIFACLKEIPPTTLSPTTVGTSTISSFAASSTTIHTTIWTSPSFNGSTSSIPLSTAAPACIIRDGLIANAILSQDITADEGDATMLRMDTSNVWTSNSKDSVRTIIISLGNDAVHIEKLQVTQADNIDSIDIAGQNSLPKLMMNGTTNGSLPLKSDFQDRIIVEVYPLNPDLAVSMKLAVLGCFEMSNLTTPLTSTTTSPSEFCRVSVSQFGMPSDTVDDAVVGYIDNDDIQGFNDSTDAAVHGEDMVDLDVVVTSFFDCKKCSCTASGFTCSPYNPCDECSWSTWSSCSKTCGTGTQVRNKLSSGRKCIETTETETQRCNVEDCPAGCEWTDWSKWSDCSVECGGGVQNRTREVEPTNAGCDGPSVQSEPCNVQSCNNETCTDGMEYSDCATQCPQTCRELRIDTEECVWEGCQPGCACPSGMYKDDSGKCVKQCPCYTVNRTMSIGEIISLEQCREWNATQAIGDGIPCEDDLEEVKLCHNHCDLECTVNGIIYPHGAVIADENCLIW
ncbi:mucin-2-like [Watersipora subatra]|uniref:mucin-2-like n=1 Tax=Watersipora subatra TaxID=2589382 RepID=UPI00355B4E6D